MFSVLLRANGVIEGIGKPQIFVAKEDVVFVLSNADARQALIERYGEGVCLGVLGDKSMNGYIETELQFNLPDDMNRRGNLSYYAKL